MRYHENHAVQMLKKNLIWMDWSMTSEERHKKTRVVLFLIPTDGLLSYFSISLWINKFCNSFCCNQHFFVVVVVHVYMNCQRGNGTPYQTMICLLFIFSIMFATNTYGVLILNVRTTPSTFQSPTTERTERYLLRLLNETDIWNKCDNINFFHLNFVIPPRFISSYIDTYRS